METTAVHEVGRSPSRPSQGFQSEGKNMKFKGYALIKLEDENTELSLHDTMLRVRTRANAANKIFFIIHNFLIVMCASARGKLSEILISGADCKSDRTSRVDERGRDGRGLVEGRGLVDGTRSLRWTRS